MISALLGALLVIVPLSLLAAALLGMRFLR